MYSDLLLKKDDSWWYDTYKNQGFRHYVLGLGMDMVKNEMVCYRCLYQWDSILFEQYC